MYDLEVFAQDMTFYFLFKGTVEMVSNSEDDLFWLLVGIAEKVI